jgi:ubiquinone/menaquinone biosynthesis C-methylase UbiE
MNLTDPYNNQYDADTSEWRELGSKEKAHNIISILQGKKIDKLLDVGSGDGSVLKYINDSDLIGSIYSTEISESGIKKNQSRNLSKLKEVVKFDGYKIPYPDNHFGACTCSHVIEHVEHPRLLLHEIARVSRYQIFEVLIDFSFFVDRKLDHFFVLRSHQYLYSFTI